MLMEQTEQHLAGVTLTTDLNFKIKTRTFSELQLNNKTKLNRETTSMVTLWCKNPETHSSNQLNSEIRR